MKDQTVKCTQTLYRAPRKISRTIFGLTMKKKIMLKKNNVEKLLPLIGKKLFFVLI